MRIPKASSPFSRIKLDFNDLYPIRWTTSIAGTERWAIAWTDQCFYIFLLEVKMEIRVHQFELDDGCPTPTAYSVGAGAGDCPYKDFMERFREDFLCG